MKKSLVLAIALTLGVAGSAFAANPFSDVPANSWAYAAVEKLAAEGIVDGMGNGKFEGNRNMTRYEMAQIVAKAMAKGVQKPELKKLAAEFAQELNALGVRVTKLEQGVKIGGEMRFRYRSIQTGDAGQKFDDWKLRARLALSAPINNKWQMGGLLESEHNLASNGRGLEGKDFQTEDTVRMRRVWAKGQLTDNVSMQVGRFAYSDKDSLLFNGLEMDGVKFDFGFGKTKVAALYGRMNSVANGATLKDGKEVVLPTKADSFGVTVEYDFTKAWGASAAYYNHRYKDGAKFADGTNVGVYDLMVTYKMDMWKVNAAYLGASKAEVGGSKSGYLFGVAYGNFSPAKANTYKVYANYAKMPGAASFGGSAFFDDASSFDKGDTWKGWEVGADYAIMKNIKLHAAYSDMKIQESGKKNKFITTYATFYF